MKYKIIHSQSNSFENALFMIESELKTYLSTDEWKLHGSLQIIFKAPNTFYCYQVVIKD